MSLKNKTIVITGGGSGLGADAARAARAAGANVVLNGRSRDKIAAIANEIDLTGRHVAFVDGDIGKPETAERLISTAVEKFGGVDVVYNNAGIFGIKPLADVTRADLNDYFNLMAGYFTVTQLAVSEMRKRGGGSIVNIGSIWSIQGIAATPCSVPAMAKGGIHALSRSLAIELAPEKIRVNVIAPAVVETPLFDGVASADEMASFNAFHPLGRNGQASDITAAFLFLADDAQSGWITGVILPVDGGVTAGRNA